MASNKKQTRQFRLKYVVFFKIYKGGNLCQLGRNTTDEEIMEADGVTLILVNSEK